MTRKLTPWSKRIAGDSIQPTTISGPETAKATFSARLHATVLGRVSPNTSKRKVTTTVDTRTARLALSIMLIAIAVANAAAAVLTRLLLRSTVARSFSGRSSRRDTRPASGLPKFSRYRRRTRGKAMKAVSEAEKKADSTRQTARRASFHKSLGSIYDHSFFALFDMHRG